MHLKGKVNERERESSVGVAFVPHNHRIEGSSGNRHTGSLPSS